MDIKDLTANTAWILNVQVSVIHSLILLEFAEV